MKVLKAGKKSLAEIFPDQGAGKEKKENRASKRKKKHTEAKAPKTETANRVISKVNLPMKSYGASKKSINFN